MGLFLGALPLKRLHGNEARVLDEVVAHRTRLVTTTYYMLIGIILGGGGPKGSQAPSLFYIKKSQVY